MPRLDLYALGTLELQLPLNQDTVSIGRALTCAICLNDPKVSREHAEVRPEGDGYVLVNHSQFGTRLNAELVKDSRPLAFGDRLYFGERFALILQQDGAVTTQDTMLPGF